MKRTLSLLLALVMVVTMIPAVFAETDDPNIDFDEMLPCEHTEKKYTDNEDGATHKVTCSACDEFEPIDEPHTDTDSDNVCDACEAALEPVVPTDANLKFHRTNTSGGNLMLGDDIRALFIVNASGLTYDEIYVEFTMNGVTTTPQKETSSTATILRYTYVVPAAYMTTDFTATVYGVKNSVTYRGEVLTFSVRKCIDASMPTWIKNGATAQCKLAMALLHYGTRTQIQFGVNTDKLATDNLNPEYEQYLPSTTPTLGTLPTDATGMQVKIAGIGPQLQEKVKLSTVFNSKTDYQDDVTIEIKHHRSKDDQVVPYIYTLADTDCVELVNTKNIRLIFDKLAPSQMRDQLEITVYENDVAVSPTYTRSVDMILNNANYLNNENMRELVYAIMNYADCAKVVFG